MIQFICIGIYLVLGWIFTYFFSTRLIKNGTWSDGPEFGPGSAFMVNICWLPMAIIMLIMWLLDNCPTFIKSFFKKVYGIK